MRFFIVFVSGLALALPAAAQDSTTARDSVITLKLPPIKKRADVITRAEIFEIRNQARNAYEVVARLRAQFFKNRGLGQNAGMADWGKGPGVVLDDSPYGSVETLRNIEVDAIEEIRYMHGTDAVIRFGPDFHGGAILVTTHH